MIDVVETIRVKHHIWKRCCESVMLLVVVVCWTTASFLLGCSLI
jgi:hypothetical protein